MAFIITRHIGESVMINDTKVELTDIKGKIARISIEAPSNVEIVRTETEIGSQEQRNRVPHYERLSQAEKVAEEAFVSIVQETLMHMSQMERRSVFLEVIEKVRRICNQERMEVDDMSRMIASTAIVKLIRNMKCPHDIVMHDCALCIRDL